MSDLVVRFSASIAAGTAATHETNPRRDSTVERDKALEMALGQIEKQFGKGSVMKMGEKGSMAIETDLHRGPGPRPRPRHRRPAPGPGHRDLRPGVLGQVHPRHARRGRGPAQRRHLRLHRRRARHGPDLRRQAIGVDVDELLISQPDTGEQALEITDMLVRSGALDVVVIDSVAALTPRAEIEGEMGDTHVGLQARLMSQALRKLTANLNKTDTICIFINQLREKIGVMFGSPETTPGGRALKFYSLGPARHPPHRVHQGRRRGRGQPHPGQGREEQGGPAVPAGRVRHHVRQGHQP